MRRALVGAVLLLVLAAPTAHAGFEPPLGNGSAPALAGSSTSAFAGGSEDQIVREIAEQFDPSGYDGIRLDVRVGSVRVEGADVDQVNAEVRVACDRGWDRDECTKRAERVELESWERRNYLVVGVGGMGMWRSRGIHLEIELTVPSEMPFQLEFGIGEAELVGLRSDVYVDMGIGEVSVTMDEDSVGTVTLDNGIGETRLDHRDGKQSVEGILGGKDVHWTSGPGDHEIVVELNIGEIWVKLE